jgi:hypothetical protein
MALHRSVTTDGDILCELHTDICSDDCETEILDGNSDIPKTSSHKNGNLVP